MIMGMMIRRHRVTADPVKPVEQPKAESVEEMPKEETIQAIAVAEVAEEEPKKSPAKKAPGKRNTTARGGRPKRK